MTTLEKVATYKQYDRFNFNMKLKNQHTCKKSSITYLKNS